MNTAWLLMAFASMPEPTSLWETTREAPLVIFARVESTTRAGTARLRVKEVWKGPPVTNVDVRYDAMSFCPPADSYSEGVDVVVFLEPTFDAANLSDFVASKGRSPARIWRSTRPLTMQTITSQPQLAALKLAVISAASLRDDQRLEWGVAAFESERTRPDALVELGSNPTLTKAQLEKLEDAFIRKPLLDDTLLSTMLLLRPQQTERLNLAFGFAIEQLAARDVQPNWFPEVVELYAQRLKRRSVERRLLGRP